MSLLCPICDNEYTGEIGLKNGRWALEPASNLLGSVPATELNGMICAEWDSDRLTVYFHASGDYDGGSVE